MAGGVLTMTKIRNIHHPQVLGRRLITVPLSSYFQLPEKAK